MPRRMYASVITIMMFAVFTHGKVWAATAPDTTTASQPVMVKDINVTKVGATSNAQNFVAVGATTFFSANDGVHGQELWKSDGTDAGTLMVKDINPNGSSFPTCLTAIGGVLYFAVGDPVIGFSLWKSDGSDAGTVLVKDIISTVSSSLSELTNVAGVLYFSAGDYSSGFSLWKSDGTPGGTVVVYTAEVDLYVSSLTNINNDLYFTVGNPVSGSTLWKSNATETVPISSFATSLITNMTKSNGKLYFTAQNPMMGSNTLWISDGTATGTVVVKDFGLYALNYLTNVNDVLFFSVYDSVNGSELWRSDGTASGTVLVKDVNPGIPSSSPSNLTNVAGVLYFTAYDGTGSALWKSDGTAVGTAQVKAGGSRNLTTVNGVLYFTVSGLNSMELWKSDATNGTVLVSDFSSDSAFGVDLSALTNVNGVLNFIATGVNGTEPWKSDGTVAGTMMLKQIFLGTGSSIGMMKGSPVVNVNGVLYFLAYSDMVNGMGLWKSDGTDAGTVLVKSVGFNRTGFSNLTNVNGILYYVVNDINGLSLWKSDGTPAGTVQVKSFGITGTIPENLTDVNGILYFTVFDNVTFITSLWKSDGTDAGTVSVSTFGHGGPPQNLTNVGGVLYFSSGGGDMAGVELWKSDGTETGTVQVKDINTGIGMDSNPSNLTNVNGVLYFTATDATNGTALWKSDGTDAGTVLVKVVSPVGGMPTYMFYSSVNINGVLYFTAFDVVNGVSLWKNDTTTGAMLVKSLSTRGYFPSSLTNVGGVLFFTFNDGLNGPQLWKSDGTAAGTVLVKAVIIVSSSATSSVKTLAKTVASIGVGPLPGAASGLLTNVNGVAYFTAYDAAHGTELWKSDGTADGTAMVMDIYGGIGSSAPLNLNNVNDALFFFANDGFHGFELWVLKKAQTIGAISLSPNALSVNGTTTASATATSTLGVTYASTTPDVCTVSGSIVTGVSSGTCTIVADQAGNGYFNAAVQVTRNIDVAKANQTIGTISFAPNSTAVTKNFAVSATSTSGLTVTFTSITPAVCTVSGDTVTSLSSGICTIAADQSGNANYNGATQVTQSIDVAKAIQSIGAISFSPDALIVNGTTIVSATASSTLAVTFTSTTPTVCTVSGSTVTGVASGACVIAADQSGNGNYNAAAQVTKNLSIPVVPSGDINGDTKVDVADALKVLQIAVGLATVSADDYAKADVAPLKNGRPAPDGVIDIADAVVILQKSIGLRSW